MKTSVCIDVESFNLICDAIEIAIGDRGFDCGCHSRFAGMQDTMKEIRDEIEKQSGCQTRDW